jgi:hypothetical protein
MKMIDRFDIPESVKHLLNVAVESGLYDATSVFVDALNFKMDWLKLAAEICEVAHCNRHVKDYGMIVKAAEGVWKDFLK